MRKSGLLCAKKFEVFTMSGGSIDDFHDGLEARIGRLVTHSLHSEALHALVIFTGVIFTGYMLVLHRHGSPRRPHGPRRPPPSPPASFCCYLVFVF